MNWKIAFQPNKKYFVFNADTGETLAKEFLRKADAQKYGLETFGWSH